MHIPSFLVGSVVSGGAFLLVDRQLSHRHKLSTRWVLAENAEREFNIVWKGAMSSVKKTSTEPPKVDKYVGDAVQKWNDGVVSALSFFGKK
mmetsp:Transcript_15551/g.22785  ORF Transcript_15551/g.22785 Transcript_15551/m.22785 type:complete len:91 (+) Transcript_15551:277-549(+)|eukprot:CAMPEP_0197244984 /NCGR_PEP_ID=MMETSP1429-20130617/9923_1 /TAXON_ID=49237 /ORGANISM="Chaetoceros  sp., Strain UNC1202" /LENGTH=90 /DNA_ID=CAMNT_0042705417 /DNA_START=419 /DNA_END=691 /DNA_ORIENTATION=-